ncbi:MAG: restriction endonuclease [Ignavibacteriales bacterium]|jgi:hypothetical protein|nr:MAG: restriction endonuclease [Ignavibacteriales bacterium]
MTNNQEIRVYEKIPKDQRENYSLFIDAIYKANPELPDMRAEVLSKLLGVRNQGGFRTIGSIKTPKLIVLFTSGEDLYWRDELDYQLGTFIYYGDNKKPGQNLLKTNLHGNEVLQWIFECSSNKTARMNIPPILVFKKSSGRDVKFLGLVVPGIDWVPEKEWLVAVWGVTIHGQRYQNYRAMFTVLDTTTNAGHGINLGWLNDIENGNAYDSIHAPAMWKRYIDHGKSKPLIARMIKQAVPKEMQLPNNQDEIEMLNYLQHFFVETTRGYGFERFSIDLLKRMDNSIVYIDQTRPYKDGGFDGEGKYRIFSQLENTLQVDFYVECKCYQMSNGIGVKETSRLISRIKDRQFGIIFTTSYISKQAYDEIIEDDHPVIFITGKDIIKTLKSDMNILNLQGLKSHLSENYR